MQDKPDLAALIASRICHDLISPIGAIGNGVELLAMEPGGTLPEMALISESVANANDRIRFFRICFGRGWRAPSLRHKIVLRSIDSDPIKPSIKSRVAAKLR